MDRREHVRRAIEFRQSPRLPFWQHGNHKLPEFPDDVGNIWEMERAQAGWFFDNAMPDDWGCGWSTTDLKNMGQVTACPLADWSALATYRPPDPRHPRGQPAPAFPCRRQRGGACRRAAPSTSRSAGITAPRAPVASCG